MPANPLDDEVLRDLGNEFAQRLRRGEQATVKEYATRFSAEEARKVEEYLTSVEKRVRVATKTTLSKSSKTIEQNTAEPPREFGRYRIERTLGEGGMGAVYLAHDSQLDRKVALKTPKFSDTSDDTTMQRFYREARSAATLQHPNICPVYDVGEIDGTHYISMAFIEGQPLSDLVRAEKQPPVSNLLKVVRKVALALHEAHLQGLIHRDLKPANIMIDRRNEPIVMDFGLARQFGADDGDSKITEEKTTTEDLLKTSRKVEARITIPGTVMGSPGYMAPEQLQGNQSQIGPASDVYAMGVLLYELLTGELPFPGTGTLISVVNSVMSDPPPDATVVRTGLDPKVATICRKAMSKKVEDRYESMQAFALALTKVLRTDSGSKASDKTGRGGKLSPELVRQKEQYELARSLYQEGQFAGAVSIMEKMVASDSDSNQYSKWAQDNIADARIKADDAALAAATGGTDDEDLWSADKSALPPKRRKSRGRRRRRRSPLIRTLITGGVAAMIIVAGFVVVKKAMKSFAEEPKPEQAVSSTDATKKATPAATTAPEKEATADGVASETETDRRPKRDETPQARTPGIADRRNGAPRERLFQLDTDADGRLSKEELEAAPAGANGLIRRIIDQFDRIDGNKDGLLDPPELERAQQPPRNPGGRPPLRRGPNRNQR